MANYGTSCHEISVSASMILFARRTCRCSGGLHRLSGRLKSFLHRGPSAHRHTERECAAHEKGTHRANLVDLRFHDLRHEATSRLFEKGLNVMEVATITGHRTLDMLKRYTHLKAEDLVKKLA
jgi:integrase